MECLVAWGVFRQIEVRFLPIHHSDEAIYQAFSRTVERLRSNNAIIVKALHVKLIQLYNKNAIGMHLKTVVNGPGLCDFQKREGWGGCR